MAEELSSSVEIDKGTPQGSRLSPLLFLTLMADLNLHISKGQLSNFADDTQLTIIEKSEEEAISSTQKEADHIINFFENVKLCNNPDKAALIYNSKGKHKDMSLEVGGEVLKSAKSEKLLGIYPQT